MKKISIIFMSVVAASMVMVGCGNKGNGNESLADMATDQDTLTTTTMVEDAVAPAAADEAATEAAAVETDAAPADDSSPSEQIREKAMAAVPTVSQLMSGNIESFFKSHGYKINKRKEYDDVVDDYETLITATLEPGEGIYVQYKEGLWEPLEVTIKGLPEARDKFFNEAKQYVASQKKKNSDDPAAATWYAKLSDDKIIINVIAD